MMGVYAIHCLVNNQRYVGSSKNLENRRSQHFWELRTNRHVTKKLQEDYFEYGLENIVFSVLEVVVNKENLFSREQYWINYYQGSLYNLSPTAGSNKGFKHSEKTRLRQSEKAKERNSREDYNLMLSNRAAQQHADKNFGSVTWTEKSKIEQLKNIKLSLNKFYESNEGKELAKKSSERMVKTQNKLWSDPEYKLKMKSVLSKNAKHRKPWVWITDEIENKTMSISSEIPDGWRRGMTKTFKGVK